MRSSRRKRGGRETPPPLAIHVLSGDLWGGAEAQAVHLIGALRRRGRWRAGAVLLNEGRTAERIRDTGARVEVLPEGGISFPSLVRNTRRFLREGEARIVHSHGYKENLIAGLAARPLRGCGRVRTQHGSPYPGGRFPHTAALFADRLLASRICERAIAVSGAIATEMRRYLPESKIRTVPNGIPLPDRRTDGEDLGPGRWIASCGRLAPEKGYPVLIEAVRLLAGEGIDARLLLIGDGPERGRLESLARERAPDRVLFAGFREKPEELLAGAELFALSSEREGLPMTLLEAMALGLPAVAPRVGGIPEVILQGRTGLLVPPGDPAELAAAIRLLLRDDPLRRRIGEEGRKGVRERFGAERTAEETEKVYGEAERR